MKGGSKPLICGRTFQAEEIEYAKTLRNGKPGVAKKQRGDQ